MKTQVLNHQTQIVKPIWLTALISLMFATPILAQSYCSSSGASTFFSYIDVVEFGGVNNQSGDDGGYGDYTNLTANVSAGTSSPIKLTAKNNFSFSSQKNRWRVWIDFNGDSDFDDPGELVLQGKAKTTLHGNITIPANLSGTARMRVSMNRYSYNGPCGAFYFGEVEDYSISLGGACAANAGSITADASSTCFINGSADLSATPDGNSMVPSGYSTLFVLTSGSGLVIENVNAIPEFTVNTTGLYTIHTLVYDTATLDLGIVVPGTTTGFDVNALLIQGGGAICASLDVAGAPIVVADPNAGTMTASADTVCGMMGSVTITATADGNAVVPAGFVNAYVLTSGAGLVIEQTNIIPEFTVPGNGLYTIHSLVFDPNTLDLGIVVPGTTTGFDVNSLLIQGGGSICASLDVAGAPVIVENPFAGSLTANASSACLVNGSATISATPDGNIHVPAGYSSLYVLTSGAGLVIEQVGPTPQFTVTSTGLYTIHTLVYNANTLDLSIVVPGTTTGVDVFGLIVPGGGSICADLDVAGAPVVVDNPDAGTMTANADTACSSMGSATITATADGNAVVPAGFVNAYVLTSGAGLVIEQTNTIPEFTVSGSGLYTIHSLVFDPNTLDLGIVVPGTTTGFDVNSLLIQGGGSICASLDVAGAPIIVEHPNAGTLSSDNIFSCLAPGGTTLSATPNNDANVPAGYATLYVLTKGQSLVIEQAGASPSFTVNSAGIYRIHTLVYNPVTLDLGIVVPGTTTGFDVNGLLVQGGGSICASLDVPGALFLVFPSFICDFFNFGGNSHRTALTGYASKKPQEAYDEVLKLYNQELSATIDVFPNPATHSITLDVSQIHSDRAAIEIFNSVGQLVQIEEIGTLDNTLLSLDISQLHSGVYFIRLTTAQGEITKSFEVR